MTAWQVKNVKTTELGKTVGKFHLGAFGSFERPAPTQQPRGREVVLVVVLFV